MILDTRNWIRIAIPSLCFLYSFSWGAVSYRNSFVEQFRSETTELELRFRGNPKGIFWDESRPGEFQGSFRYGEWEEAVVGTRRMVEGSWLYEFEYTEGKFSGKLQVVKSFPCHSKLSFQAHELSGELHGAICPQ